MHAPELGMVCPGQKGEPKLSQVGVGGDVEEIKNQFFVICIVSDILLSESEVKYHKKESSHE